MVKQQWVLMSLTIWGSLITVFTALLPALKSIWGVDISVDWVSSFDEGVRTAITAVGSVVALVMILYDRVFEDTNKKLVWSPRKDDTLKKMIFKQ